MKRRTYPVGRSGRSPYVKYNKAPYKYSWQRNNKAEEDRAAADRRKAA